MNCMGALNLLSVIHREGLLVVLERKAQNGVGQCTAYDEARYQGDAWTAGCEEEGRIYLCCKERGME